RPECRRADVVGPERGEGVKPPKTGIPQHLFSPLGQRFVVLVDQVAVFGRHTFLAPLAERLLGARREITETASSRIHAVQCRRLLLHDGREGTWCGSVAALLHLLGLLLSWGLSLLLPLSHLLALLAHGLPHLSQCLVQHVHDVCLLVLCVRIGMLLPQT